MAEIVGIVAAVAQLTELAGTLLLRANRLRNKMKQLPKNMRQAGKSLNRFAALLESLHSELEETGGISDVLSDASVLQARELLGECTLEIDALDSLLLRVTPSASDMKLKYARRVLVGFIEEDEIKLHMQRLNDLLQSMMFWCDEQGLLLTWKQFKKIAHMDDRIGSLGTQITSFEQSLKQPRPLCPESIDDLAGRIVSQMVVKPQLMAQVVRSLYDSGTENADPKRTCTCERFKWQPKFFGTIQYLKPRPGRACAIHGPVPQTRYRTGLSISPTVFARGFSFAFECCYGAGGYSISTRLLPIRFVNILRSPAFACIKAAKATLLQSRKLAILPDEESEEVDRILKDLHGDLLDTFQEGTSSARDQSELGWTLIHELVSLFDEVERAHTRCKSPQKLELILDMLIAGGAQIDSIASISSSFGESRQGTALQLFMGWFAPPVWSVYSRVPPEYPPTMLTMLISRLGDSSTLTIQEDSYVNDRRSCISIVRQRPDVALDVGCSMLAAAAAQRDEETLAKLIRRGNDVNATNFRQYNPLCFAVGWLPGMNILLEAGSQPSVALEVAIFHRDLEAVKLLLQYPCNFFHKSWPVPPRRLYERSIWQFAIDCLQDFSPQSPDLSILRVLVQALADNRRQLMQLATSIIPAGRLCELGWQDPLDLDRLLDLTAYPIAQETQRSISYELPMNMWPNPELSLFSDYCMSSVTCQCLFDAGFRLIAEEDSQGLTPLAIQWKTPSLNRKDRTDFTRWFLDHGADPKFGGSDHHLVHHIALRVAAPLEYRFLVPWPAEATSSLKIPQLQGLRGMPDACMCFCSSHGCTPGNLLLKSFSEHFTEFPKAEDVGGWIYKSGWEDWKMHCLSFESLWQMRMCDIYDWQSQAFDDREELHEMCRLELFERLGMLHTCCSWPYRKLYLDGFRAPEYLSPSEIEEIRSEDRTVAQKLEQIMEFYSRLAEQHAGRFEAMWNAWWEIIADSLAPLRMRFWDDKVDIIPPENVIEDGELETMLKNVEKYVNIAISKGGDDVSDSSASRPRSESLSNFSSHMMTLDP